MKVIYQHFEFYTTTLLRNDTFIEKQTNQKRNSTNTRPTKNENKKNKLK